MFNTYNIFDKFRSISVERINDFLNRKCIEHQCTELNRIQFKLENLTWDIFVDGSYFKIELAFPIFNDATLDKRVNTSIAEEACLEVTKLIKVLKAHYTSYEYIDKDNNNELVKYKVLLFDFESFCYNMFDFCRLFYDALNIIICGYKEYYKQYDEIESRLPITPIGFRQFERDETKEKSQTTNRHHVGFV